MNASCIQSIVHSCGVLDSPAHTHNGYQLFYICKGKAKLHISGKEYTACAPCLVFISNLEQHAFTVQSEDYERYYINIDAPSANSQIKNHTLLSIFSNRPNWFCHVIPITQINEQVDAIIKILYGEVRSSHESFNEMSSLLIKSLLILLYRYSPESFPSIESGITGTIWHIKKELEENVQRDITLKKIAEEYHLSTYYLAHTFKRITGYSLMQYQLLCRLSFARELLCSSDMNITEIAHSSGFSDMSNFARYFRREVGCTPSEYRNRTNFNHN